MFLYPKILFHVLLASAMIPHSIFGKPKHHGPQSMIGLIASIMKEPSTSVPWTDILAEGSVLISKGPLMPPYTFDCGRDH